MPPKSEMPLNWKIWNQADIETETETLWNWNRNEIKLC